MEKGRFKLNGKDGYLARVPKENNMKPLDPNMPLSWEEGRLRLISCLELIVADNEKEHGSKRAMTRTTRLLEKARDSEKYAKLICKMKLKEE